MYLRLDQWNYWKLASTNTTSWAEGYTTFNWRFRTEADDVFAIRISATVGWGDWIDPTPEYPNSCDEYWRKAGETTVSQVISIANYWQ